MDVMSAAQCMVVFDALNDDEWRPLQNIQRRVLAFAEV